MKLMPISTRRLFLAVLSFLIVTNLLIADSDGRYRRWLEDIKESHPDSQREAIRKIISSNKFHHDFQSGTFKNVRTNSLIFLYRRDKIKKLNLRDGSVSHIAQPETIPKSKFVSFLYDGVDSGFYYAALTQHKGQILTKIGKFDPKAKKLIFELSLHIKVASHFAGCYKPVLLLSRDKIFVLLMDGGLICLSKSGSIIWQKNPLVRIRRSWFRPDKLIQEPSGRTFISLVHKKLYWIEEQLVVPEIPTKRRLRIKCLEPEGGRILWQKNLEGVLFKLVTRTEPTNVIVVNTPMKGRFGAYSTPTLKKLWHSDFNVLTSASFGEHKGSFIVPTIDNRLILVNPLTAQQKTLCKLPRWHRPYRIISDGKSIICESGNVFYRVTTGSGRKWVREIGEYGTVNMAVFNEKLVIFRRSGKILCLNKLTGKTIWTTDMTKD